MLELEHLQKVAQEADDMILAYYRENSQFFQSPQITPIERRIAEIQPTLEALLTKYTRNYPSVIEAQGEINSLQGKLLVQVKKVLQKNLPHHQLLVFFYLHGIEGKMKLKKVLV